MAYEIRIVKYWFWFNNCIQSDTIKTSNENKFRPKRLEFNFKIWKRLRTTSKKTRA